MVESAQRDFVARCSLPAEEFYADAFTSEADKHGATVPTRPSDGTPAAEGAGRSPSARRQQPRPSPDRLR